MRIVFIAYMTALGIAVGSFLNVVIYRVPLKLSIIRPRSFCPSCKTTLTTMDNIPIVSYLALRAKCRHCQAAISWQYPCVEVVGGILFASGTWHFGFTWQLPVFLVVFAGLLALSVTDFLSLLVPKRIVYAVLLLELPLMIVASTANHEWSKFVTALICAAVWFLLFFTLNALSPRLLGFGDVRLSPVLGLALGWLGIGYVFWGFFLANLVGAVISLSLIATKRMTREQRIPYAVFLSLGLFLSVLTGHLFAGHYRGF